VFLYKLSADETSCRRTTEFKGAMPHACVGMFSGAIAWPRKCGQGTLFYGSDFTDRKRVPILDVCRALAKDQSPPQGVRRR
jgi:hypothetical protein